MGELRISIRYTNLLRTLGKSRCAEGHLETYHGPMLSTLDATPMDLDVISFVGFFAFFVLLAAFLLLLVGGGDDSSDPSSHSAVLSERIDEDEEEA